jgi:hypothetical protein
MKCAPLSAIVVNMSSRTLKILEQVDELSDQDRAIVAAELELGPAPDPAVVDAAWKQELARRLEALSRGEVELIDTKFMIQEPRAKYTRR